MRRGVPPTHAAVRHHSRDAQSPYDPAILRQRRRPREWPADIARRYRHGIGVLSPPIAGERLMPAPPNLTQPAGDWINPGSVHAREPAIAAGLPVAAEDGGAIAVLRAQNFAAHSRRFPLRLLWFVVVVLVPVALAAAYYLLIAADQYVAEFRFALRTVEPARAEIGGILQGNIAPSPVGVDSYAVVQYLGSRDVIDELGKTLDLREMFSRPEADWLARLDLPVSIEEMVRYWKGQVDAFFDATNGTIVVKARAFTQQDALKLAEGILASSERLVNELSARARRDTVRDAEGEVARAERRLKAAFARVREFRDKEGIIDPRKSADATIALAGRVRDELVRADTELATLKHYMRDDAPSI